MNSLPTLPGNINVVYGQTAVKLTKPSGATALMLHVNKGGFTIRTGDHVSSGMPSTLLPGAAVTDDTGAWVLVEGQSYEISPAPAALTVKGYGADSAITYAWI